MSVKRMIAVVAIASLLAIAPAPPKPARADTTEVVLLAAVALGLYVVLVVIGATIAYRTAPPLPLVDERPNDTTPPQETVRVGRHCPPVSGNLALLCW